MNMKSLPTSVRMRTTLCSPGSPWPFAAWDSVEGAFIYAREKKKRKSNSIRKKNGVHVKRFHFGENENSKVLIFSPTTGEKKNVHT